MKRSKTNGAPALPSVVTILGDAIEIKTRLNNGTEKVYKFPRSRRAFLTANTTGRRLFVLPKKSAPASKLKSKRVTKAATAAAKQYENWSGYEANQAALLDVRKPRLNKVGRAVHVVYRSDKWNGRASDYIHTFDRPPIVWADRSGAPSVVALTGGNIRVTSRGITG